MLQQLNDVFVLLSDVDVRGKKNLNNLLAAIQIVEKLYDEVKSEQSDKE